ncbi:MAG: ABC transporter substrate-binding protein [Anaerovoracaceae bacterium]
MKKRSLVVVGMTLVTSLSVCACSQGELDLNSLDYTALCAKAKSEGELVSLAMPDTWANWEETWDDLTAFYGIVPQDKDMCSEEELNAFKQGEGDICDVGYSYAEKAEREQLTLAYKTSYWNEIPTWAKDDDGDWIVSYTGAMAFMVNDKLQDPPRTWKEVLAGPYSVSISNVSIASQGQYAIYAAALALGGTAKDPQAGISAFMDLAKAGRLKVTPNGRDGALDSQADVIILWDYLAFGYREKAREKAVARDYHIFIPSDGSVTIGYASLINKKAKNPHGAALAREYILSDAGQINLARGYAMPIRSVALPEDILKDRVPQDEYTEEMIQNGLAFDDKANRKIIKGWEEEIVPLLRAEGGRP